MLPFMALKFARLWYGTETRGIRREILLAFCSVLIVPLGVGRWLRWRSEARGPAAIVLGCVAYFMILHWITLPQIRYMLPVYPLLLAGSTAAVA